MSTSLSLSGALFSSIFFIVLALGLAKLEGFNRAKLRKLRETSRSLAEQLEQSISERRRLAGQLLTFLLFCLSFASFHHWGRQQPWQLLWGAMLGVYLLGFVALHISVEKLSLKSSARLLISYLALAGLASYLLSPIILPLSFLLDNIRAGQAADPSLEKPSAEDEILSLVEESLQEEKGAGSASGLELEEKRMLNGVINLDKTYVHEIMTPRVDIDALPEEASIEEIKRTITDTGHSRVPIYHQSIDSISGVVYAKDLLDDDKLAKAKNAGGIAHSPVFIPESKNISDLLDEFRQTRNHIAIVLDEYGGTAGMVTIEDILEEIVGEIHDEYDHGESDKPENLSLEEDGSLVCDGRLTIWELNKLLDCHISEEQGFDTLAGYIMASLGKIPKTGEHLLVDELEIDILEADKRKLTRLKLRKKSPPQNPDKAD